MSSNTFKLPQVVICGRTNVGKSTLFNRLSETKKALVSDLAGTTRDRNFATIEWQGKKFELIDTGGLDIFDQPELVTNIKKQITAALQQASLVLFVIDGQEDLLPQDRKIAKEIRDLKKPVILGINKIDSLKLDKQIDPKIHQLNFDHHAAFSASNGSRTGDLLDLITEVLPNKKQPLDEEIRPTKIAIIGQPNVGKSSLLNAIIGEERVVVSEIAHTTRDINDIEFEYKKNPFLLIDTAGMRRKARVGNWKGKEKKLLGRIEKEGVKASLHSVEQADVVVLVLEAQREVEAQDKSLIKLISQRARGLIVVINKWDLIKDKETNTYQEYEKYFRKSLPFINWAPMIFISAITKTRTKKVLDLALQITENQTREISRVQLRDAFEHMMNKYKPLQRQTITHGQRKKELRLGGLLQTGIRPPTFWLKSKNPKTVSPALVKIMEKMLREKYDFTGTQIIISTQKK